MLSASTIKNTRKGTDYIETWLPNHRRNCFEQKGSRIKSSSAHAPASDGIGVSDVGVTRCSFSQTRMHDQLSCGEVKHRLEPR